MYFPRTRSSVQLCQNSEISGRGELNTPPTPLSVGRCVPWRNIGQPTQVVRGNSQKSRAESGDITSRQATTRLRNSVFTDRKLPRPTIHPQLKLLRRAVKSTTKTKQNQIQQREKQQKQETALRSLMIV
jgi:hypothetical protein